MFLGSQQKAWGVYQVPLIWQALKSNSCLPSSRGLLKSLEIFRIPDAPFVCFSKVLLGTTLESDDSLRGIDGRFGCRNFLTLRFLLSGIFSSSSNHCHRPQLLTSCHLNPVRLAFYEGSLPCNKLH